jgi:hypothetical protein
VIKTDDLIIGLDALIECCGLVVSAAILRPRPTVVFGRPEHPFPAVIYQQVFLCPFGIASITII